MNPPTLEQANEVERCCGSICYMNTDKGPHWGDVSVFEEESWGDDYYWIHSCEGHPDYNETLPPPEECTTIREDDELWADIARGG